MNYFHLKCCQNCVNTEKNRLGVCCFQRRNILVPSRRVRQDAVEVIQPEVLDTEENNIEVDEELFNDIFINLPQDDQMTMMDIIENIPKVLMVEKESSEESDEFLRGPVVVMNIK